MTDEELAQIAGALDLAEERGGKSDAALVMECAQVRALLDAVKELREETP